MPDTKKVKDLTINKFGSVDAYKYAKQNGLIGDNDVNVLSPDAVPSGGGGSGYVLTEADKNEIAEIAAGMVDTALLNIIGTGEVTE